MYLQEKASEAGKKAKELREQFNQLKLEFRQISFKKHRDDNLPDKFKKKYNNLKSSIKEETKKIPKEFHIK